MALETPLGLGVVAMGPDMESGAHERHRKSQTCCLRLHAHIGSFAGMAGAEIDHQNPKSFQLPHTPCKLNQMKVEGSEALHLCEISRVLFQT